MTSMNIALDHASLGLYVFPVARNKSPLTPNGYLDATLDPVVITARWSKSPSANVGFAAGKSGKSVLDIDHGLVDEAGLRAWCQRNRISAETYIVRTGSRPDFKVHLYFDGTMPDCNWELDGCSGQVKSLKGYVLAAGSVAEHRSASNAPYEVLSGSLGNFAPLPDTVRNIRPKDKKVSTTQGIRTKWKLPVHDGDGRDDFLVEQAGLMRHAGCGGFASPVKIGRLPYSYTGVWRELERAAKVAGTGHLGTHSFRHTHRSWLDAVGTPIAVQQKMMRHADIRTTMNIYGDVVTDEMSTAGSKVAQLAFRTNGAQTERMGS